MLVIRFFRIGKKNQPSFKIVVTDKRKSSVKGRYVEEVGFIDPLKDKKFLRAERIKYWISVGAIPSPTVNNLLVTEKIIESKKIHKFKKSKKKEEKKPETPKVGAAAAPTAPSVKEVKPQKEVKTTPEKKDEKKEEAPEAPKAAEVKPAEVKPGEPKPVEKK